MFTGNATCCGIFAFAFCKSSSLWSIRHGATPDDRCSWKDMAEKMELGGRGCSRVEKSNLGECVKIMTKKLWCYSPNKSQKECARKFVALRWQTKNYHVHSLCVGWRNHAEVTPGMAYKKLSRTKIKKTKARLNVHLRSTVSWRTLKSVMIRFEEDIQECSEPMTSIFVQQMSRLYIVPKIFHVDINDVVKTCRPTAYQSIST